MKKPVAIDVAKEVRGRWQLNADGTFVFKHVTELNSVTVGSVLGVQLTYVETLDEFLVHQQGGKTERKTFAFGMTAVECRKLAELLTRKAVELETPRGPAN